MTTLQFAVAVGLKLFLMVFFVFNMGALLTWNDRRQSAMMQDRVGPNRAVLKIGKLEFRVLGLLHTAADGLKFFFKEEFTPPKADKFLYGLAPILALAPVIALTGVIPMTDALCLDKAMEIAPRTGAVCAEALGGAVAPLDVGLLFVFAIAGQGVVAAAIAGWASDNKFSLMGSLRAASQMVSYEVAIGLSLVGAFMTYGTVRLEEMVRWQGENAWGIFVQPLGFVLFFVSAVAETKRIPFDLPEAESELVAGYMTEYAGMKFGMFYFAEYMEVVTSSMLLVVIFLGGWQLPFFHPDGISIAFGDSTLFEQQLPHAAMIGLGVLVFFGKTIAMCVFQAFVRWSLPRFRYDQLMRLGWKVLLPLALANIFATGVVILAEQSAGPRVVAALSGAAQGSQLVVVAFATFLFVRFFAWIFGRRGKRTQILGSSAIQAVARGGTKHTAMQN